VAIGGTCAANPKDLWTFQRNKRARSFYENHGFVAISETDGSRNEEKEPDVMYSWQREHLERV
jgi:putative acetyltransferase